MKFSHLALIVPALLAVAGTTPTQAQGPHIPNMAQRSGLLSRFAPMMKTNLPHDPDRDTFFGTYYNDRPVAPNTDNMFNGGMYGQRLDTKCTSTDGPYFYGTVSANRANCPECLPEYKTSFGRFGKTLLGNRWRPVGSYYQNGATVPIYDFRPFSPGPGQDLWPWYLNGSGG